MSIMDLLDNYLSHPSNNPIDFIPNYLNIIYIYIYIYIYIFRSLQGFASTAIHTQLDLTDFSFALFGYLLWQFFYIIKTEIVDRNKLDTHPELLTSLRWLSSDSKNAFAKTVLTYMRKIRLFKKEEEFNSRSFKTKATFVCCQFLFTMFTFVPTYIFYYSRAAHLSYIGLIFTVSVFNGASFYIEIFSKRYNSRIEKMEAMLQIAKAASGIVDDISALKRSISADKNLSHLSSSSSSSSSSSATATTVVSSKWFIFLYTYNRTLFWSCTEFFTFTIYLAAAEQ